MFSKRHIRLFSIKALRIWQNDDYNNLNRLHGFIYKLRKYLSDSAALELLNVRGIGYKLSKKS